MTFLSATASAENIQQKQQFVIGLHYSNASFAVETGITKFSLITTKTLLCRGLIQTRRRVKLMVVSRFPYPIKTRSLVVDK